MGEFADMEMENGFDAMLNGYEYEPGEDGEFTGRDALGRKHRKTCLRCGEKGLVWRKTERGWRLFQGDVMHTCKPKQSSPETLEKVRKILETFTDDEVDELIEWWKSRR